MPGSPTCEGRRALREAVQHGPQLLAVGLPAYIRAVRRCRDRGDGVGVGGAAGSSAGRSALLAQDRLLQRQLGARVEAGVLGEQLPERAQRVEGLDLATGPQAGRARGSPTAFLERLPRDGRLGGRQDTRVLAEREQADQPGLLGDPELLERRAFREDVGVVAQVGVRLAASRPPEPRRASRRAATSARLGQPPVPVPSWLASGASAVVARRTSAANRCTSTSAASTLSRYPWSVVSRTPRRRQRAQSGDVRVQRAVRRRRRFAGPHQVGEQAGGTGRPGSSDSAATIERGFRAPASTQRGSPSSPVTSTRDAPNTPTRTGTT